jgi:hypothetical protein
MVEAICGRIDALERLALRGGDELAVDEVARLEFQLRRGPMNFLFTQSFGLFQVHRSIPSESRFGRAAKHHDDIAR